MSRSREVLWAAALEELAQDMARGYATATVERVVKHVRRFACAVHVGPWDVEPLDVFTWLDTQDVTPAAAYGYRTSLRTFYRWALRAGRIYADPTEGPGAHDALRKLAPPGGGLEGLGKVLTCLRPAPHHDPHPE